MERILSYSPGSPEREELLKEIHRITQQTIEIPLIIDGKGVST